MGKEIVEAPEATLIVAGTAANFAFELDSAIARPDGPAKPARDNEPEIEVVDPPTMEFAESVKPSRTGGKIVRVAAWGEDPVRVAEIFAVVETETPWVEIENVALPEPEGIETEAGTPADDMLEVSLTSNPEGGACPDKITDPLHVVPP